MLPVLVLSLALQAEPEAPVAPEPAPALRKPAGLGLIVMLTGAIVAGVGVGMRLSAGEVWDRIDRGYPEFSSYEELQNVRASGELQQRLAFGFVAAGAITLAAGAILTLVLSTPPNTFATVAPTADGGAAFSLRGTFP